MKKLGRFIGLAILLLLFRYIFSVTVAYLFPTYIIDEGRVILNESAYISKKNPGYKISGIWGKGQSKYFVDIALNGYEQSADAGEIPEGTSLYPLYPLLLRTVYKIAPFKINIDGVYLIGALLSTVFFGTALFILDKLLDLIWFHEEKKYAVFLLILFFPGSFFFNLAYSESLFFLLSVAFLLQLFKKKYLGASVLLSLAVVTRMAGIVLIVPFLTHMFLLERYNKRFNMVSKSVLYLSIILLPLLIFYYHIFSVTGSFFGSLQVSRGTHGFMWLPFGYFFDVFFKENSTTLLAEMFNFVILITAFMVLVFAFIKTYLAFEYRTLEQNTIFIFALVYTLMLSSLSGGSMMFRYLAACPALFILPIYFYNQMVRNKYFLGVLFVFLSLQALFFTLYLTGIPAYGY